VVIAVVDDEFVCRRLAQQGEALRLQGESAGCADILIDEGQSLQIWGVVTQAIKSMPG
jgi:DNA polymerase V